MDPYLLRTIIDALYALNHGKEGRFQEAIERLEAREALYERREIEHTPTPPEGENGR